MSRSASALRDIFDYPPVAACLPVKLMRQPVLLSMSIDRLLKNRGMTLVEVLVAVFILTVGILGALLFFTRSMQATESAQDLTLATTHAEMILEEMRALPTLLDIQERKWGDWAQHQGLNILPGEQVKVSFSNYASNILQINVVVNWRRGGRSGEVNLYTEMTK